MNQTSKSTHMWIHGYVRAGRVRLYNAGIFYACVFLNEKLFHVLMLFNKYASVTIYVKFKTISWSTHTNGINENRKGNKKIESWPQREMVFCYFRICSHHLPVSAWWILGLQMWATKHNTLIFSTHGWWILG